MVLRQATWALGVKEVGVEQLPELEAELAEASLAQEDEGGASGETSVDCRYSLKYHHGMLSRRWHTRGWTSLH